MFEWLRTLIIHLIHLHMASNTTMKPGVKILSRHISLFEYVCVQYKHVHEWKTNGRVLVFSWSTTCPLHIYGSVYDKLVICRFACPNHACYLWWFCYSFFIYWSMVVKVGIGSLFFTPQGEKPFGSWRENHELDINAKIATRQLLSSSPRPCCNCSVFSLVFFFLPAGNC